MVGDSKVPWELNRHQWLVRLGQAYRLTGERRYHDAWVRTVRHWIIANPRGRGIAWASSLEVALRLISWLWALHLFADRAGEPDPLHGEIRGPLVEHARHTERYLSYYYAPNTHLTGEALALLYAGLTLPHERGARRWRDLGMRILVQECERQIAPDGVYYEQSTCYQRYTAEIYLHAMILAAGHGLDFPPGVPRRIQSLIDHLLWVCSPDGTMPRFGDADGGWLMPLSGRRPDDGAGVFSTAAAWFGRPDYATAAGEAPAPETLWLLGDAGIAGFAAAGRAAPEAPTVPGIQGRRDGRHA